MKLRKERNPVAHHSVAAYASCFCKYSSCACGCYDLCTCAGTGLYTSTSNANGGFADKYISFLYALGILEGKGDNMFGPKDSLTRAQAITVVNKLIGRLPGEGATSFGAVADQMKTWPDNMDTTAWYYAAIQEATNSHDYTLDVNFNTFGDLKGDIFQNIKHPVTERWTLIR